MIAPNLSSPFPMALQMTKEASASVPSEEESERQSRSIAKLREDLRRKEGLLRAAQAQLEELKGLGFSGGH